MGSFSYSCQLSGLPITSGTKCAILPMLPRDNFYDNGEAHFRKVGKSMFCSNEGVNVFFNEYAFPIFGEYDDYGGIENIVIDDNTKCLEEYFELTIEQICEVLCNNWDENIEFLKKKNPKHELLKKTSLVWLHAEFFENLATKKSSYWSDKLDLGVDGLLIKLGFKLNGTVKKERYDQEWEKDGLKIHTDDNWINVPNEWIYSLTDLKKYCEKNGVSLDIEELNKMGYDEQVYECVLPFIDNLKGGDRWKTDRAIRLLLGDEHKIRMGGQSHEELSIKILEFSIERIEKGEEDIFKNDMTVEEMKAELQKLKKETKKQPAPPKQYLAEFYFDKIKSEGNGFLKSNIVKWHIVKSYYYTLGKYLYPIGTSPQDGDYKSTKLFFEAVNTTLDSVMKQRMEDGYEEDEENEEENA